MARLAGRIAEGVYIQQERTWGRYAKQKGGEDELFNRYSCAICNRKEKIPADVWMYDAVGTGSKEDREDPRDWVEPNHRNGAKEGGELLAGLYHTLPLESRTGAVAEVEPEPAQTTGREKLPPPTLLRMGSDGVLKEMVGGPSAHGEDENANLTYPIRVRE